MHNIFINFIMPFIIAISPLLLFLGYAHFRLPKIEVRPLTGRGGFNTITKAVVDPTVTYPIAVLGQEVFESRWKKWPHRLILNKTNKGIRERELRGHEAEVQVAKRLRLHKSETVYEHRKRKARNIKHGYAKAFKNWTEDKIVKRMEKHSRKTERWAEKWTKYLVEQYNKNKR